MYQTEDNHHLTSPTLNLCEEVRTAMLVLVLCHFRAPVVKNLVVVKPGLNSKKRWATAPKSRAAMPAVIWCCRFGIREIFKCAIACRVSLGATIRFRCRTTSRHSIARQIWGSFCLLRPKISSYLIASSFGLSSTRVLEAAGCSG